MALDSVKINKNVEISPEKPLNSCSERNRKNRHIHLKDSRSCSTEPGSGFNISRSFRAELQSLMIVNAQSCTDAVILKAVTQLSSTLCWNKIHH